MCKSLGYRYIGFRVYCLGLGFRSCVCKSLGYRYIGFRVSLFKCLLRDLRRTLRLENLDHNGNPRPQPFNAGEDHAYFLIDQRAKIVA